MGFPVGGTGVGGSPVPPGIYESQTSAFNEVMKDVIGMLPFDTSVIIPFTQQEYDTVFHYRSEPGKPSLHPLLFLRTSSEYERTEEDTFNPIYQELLNHLPPDMAEWLSSQMQQPFAERDPDAVALHHTLSTAASALGWLAVVTAPIAPNNAKAANLLRNIALPYVAFGEALGQVQFIVGKAFGFLDQAGPNNRYFDFFNNSLTEIQNEIVEAMAAQREIEKGLITEDIRQRLIQSAHLAHEIASRLQSLSTENTLTILGIQMEALATATAALALSHGTPSLALGSAVALIGINRHNSVLGPFGLGLDTIMDSVVDGILHSFVYGPEAEISELTALYHDLLSLRDSG